MNTFIQNRKKKQSKYKSCLSTDVAFSARIMGIIQFNAGHKIVFNNVLSNVGNGYDSTTGIFTAPRNGTYTLTLVTMATGGEHYAQLRVNGVRQSVARGSSSLRTGAWLF